MTPDTAELKALLARVEADNVEADHDLTFDIGRALGVVEEAASGGEAMRPILDSIDSALALTERVLPGWQIIGFEQSWTGPYPAFGRRENLQSRAWLRMSAHSYIMTEAQAPSPALAIIAATLKAKIAETEST